jgi:hypothetical protein
VNDLFSRSGGKLVASQKLVAMHRTDVTPAKAGVHFSRIIDQLWIPAFAGMTAPDNLATSF